MPTPISGTAYRQFVAAELPVGSVPRTPPEEVPGQRAAALPCDCVGVAKSPEASRIRAESWAS